MPRVSRTGRVVVSSLFVVVLSLPLVAQFVEVISSVPTIERPIVASKPRLDWNLRSLASFPASFNAWYDDHFALRRLLLFGHSLFKVVGLGLSSSDKVLLGREGWLYYRPEVEHWRGKGRHISAELAAWGAYLLDRKAWFAQQGMQYLFVMAPNKSTIYPEFLPQAQTRFQVQTDSEQLAADMAERGGVPFLDLTPMLREARREQLVYYRTDSHWNETGCLVAYRVILGQLAAMGLSLTPYGPRDFTTIRGTFRADLAVMLRLAEYYGEITTDYSPHTFPPRELPVDYDLAAAYQAAAFEYPNGHGILLIVGDSFGRWKLLALLAQHFQRTLFVHRSLFPGTVAAFEQLFATLGSPDVVLEEAVERELGLPLALSLVAPRNG